ncbi:uncharacterized protein C8orf48-like [Chanos chanos]|uniref:Uncharacterized protein C8orf48-like n=1 Tax=Chanos chanos TaxID=29144 RepID=A0A6J2UKK5_CHACN|nr:uncharacterized protein C8orf48 homolog [Chanos chanos]
MERASDIPLCWKGSMAQQKEERMATRAFCQKKINQLQRSQADLSVRREKHTHNRPPVIKPAQTLAGLQVPPQLICLQKLKTFNEEMKKAAVEEFHEASGCGACLHNQATLALHSFISRKKSQVCAQALEEKMQSHLYNKDSIYLLGQILREVPRPEDDPCIVWKAMMERWTSD